MKKKYIYLSIVFVLSVAVGVELFFYFKETNGRTLDLENYGTSSSTASTSTTTDTTGSPSLEEGEDYPYLTELSYEEWKALYDKGERFVFTVVQTYCGFCKQFKPVLNKIAEEHDVPIYYVDVLTLSDSDFDAFTSTITYFKENERWGTPLTLIYENQKEIDNLDGYVGEEQATDFLQKNKMI